MARAGESVMGGVRLAAVLFVIGTVLLALTGRRMDMLRAEVATRPMRSIALGVLGVIGSIVTIVALCVTIIGIPVAIVAVIVAGFALLGSMCAVLSVVGEGLLRHRTENPYVHLAVGCALYAALAALPWWGHIVVVATVLAAIGVLVATRGAGLAAQESQGQRRRDGVVSAGWRRWPRAGARSPILRGEGAVTSRRARPRALQGLLPARAEPCVAASVSFRALGERLRWGRCRNPMGGRSPRGGRTRPSTWGASLQARGAHLVDDRATSGALPSRGGRTPKHPGEVTQAPWGASLPGGDAHPSPMGRSPKPPSQCGKNGLAAIEFGITASISARVMVPVSSTA